MLSKLPKSICIVGGGPVGVEFATFFQALGTEVHLVEIGKHLLISYDQKLGDELANDFKNKGIGVYLETVTKEISDNPDKTLKITLSNNQTFACEYILSAIGVEVLSDYIKIPLASERGRILVNDKLETSMGGIYAIGDLTGRSGSAYGAAYEADFVAGQILEDNKDELLSPSVFPDVVFTEPEVASVGLSSVELAEHKITFDTYEIDYKNNSKARILAEPVGAAYVYVNQETDIILGVHLIGAHATETIHIATTWVQSVLTRSIILKQVWGHPVLAEVLRDSLKSEAK